MAVGGYLFFRLDDETHRVCETTLARLCEPWATRVGSARFHAGSGVTMYDVEILQRRPGRASQTLLEIAELRIEGQFDVSALLSGKPRMRRVVAKGARVFATRRLDGRWNLESFRPPARGAGPPPALELQDATLFVRDQTAPEAGLIKLEHLHATVTPASNGDGFLLDAGAEETLAKKIRIKGTLSGDAKRFDLQMVTEGLPLSPPIVSLLKANISSPLPLPSVFGFVSLDTRVSRATPGGPIDWRVGFQLEQGELRTPLLARPLGSIRVAGEASTGQLRIDRLSATWGDATLRVAGRRQGWSWNSPAAFRVRVDNFNLAETPTGYLFGQARKLWDRFKPLGVANLALDAQYNGDSWAPRATVHLTKASFEDREKFAYRLTDGSGRLDLNGGAEQTGAPAPLDDGATLTLDLTAQVEGTPIRIGASLRDLESMKRPPPDGAERPKMPPGWVEITGNGVPITPRVVAALSQAEARKFVQSLNPSGRVDLRWRADRPDATNPRHSSALDLRLVDCRINYDRFPYPLSGVTGWVRQRGKQWEFRELRSIDARGRTLVTGSGKLTPQPGGMSLALRFDGEDAPLNQSLYAALPSSAQQAWEFLQPRGQLGFTAHVTRLPGQRLPQVRLDMRPAGKVMIEPTLSEGGRRYRLENLDGQFDWREGRLLMRAARATHGRTSYSADGEWASIAGGGWRLLLQGANADRLAFNHDFLAAAPVGLRSVIETLQPSGLFDLFNSRLEIIYKNGPTTSTVARWDAAINCHQATLTCGVPLDGISGVVRLSGSADGASAQTAGELELDSLFWNDLQLTNIRGPLWANDSDCFLGEGVAEKIGGQKRRVEATAYGGKTNLNSWIQYGGRPRYGLQIGLDGVDVTRLSAEWLERPEALSGSLDGQLQFEGAGESIYGLTGKGDLTVSDADLYELPLFLSLLKYLRNRAPDNTAFTQLAAKFDVQGEQIRFAELNLEGDAVSLYGRGTATLQRELDLVFHSLVGRNEFAVPVIRSLVGQASEQILRLRVLGTVDAPEIRREALPIVGNVFGQLQNGPPTTANGPNNPPSARR